MTIFRVANLRSLWRKRGGRTLVVRRKDVAEAGNPPSSIDDRFSAADRSGRAPLTA